MKQQSNNTAEITNQLKKQTNQFREKTEKELLKQQLLEHYRDKDPCSFVQIDGRFDPCGLEDEGGDSLGVTHCDFIQETNELMSGFVNVRVLVTPQTKIKDVLILLKMMRKNTKKHGVNPEETMGNYYKRVFGEPEKDEEDDLPF